MRRVTVTLCLGVLAAFVPVPNASSAENFDPRQYVKDRVDERTLSSGARVWLQDPPKYAAQRSGLVTENSPSFGTNVDVNDPEGDLAAGQTEPAIAARSGRLVVAWNDITGFFADDSTRRRASLTGVGYSNNSGRSFTDLRGLPNSDPLMQWMGDPSVVAIDSRHFIVGSLYYPAIRARCFDPQGNPRDLRFKLAVSVATVSLTGESVSFTDPIVVVDGGNACDPFVHDFSLLEKPFLSYDRTSRTLAMSYTRFDFGGDSQLGSIEIARALVPANPASLRSTGFSSPIVVWEAEPVCFNSSEASQCGAVNTGSYPSVAPGGDVYIAWERNWISNFRQGDPYVHIHAALVPKGAKRPAVGGQDHPRVVTEGQVNSRDRGGVKSLDGVVIAGYTGQIGGIGNDFPRIAVDAPLGKVIFVWNDASAHPLGDIWLRALPLNLAIKGKIHRVNDRGDYALHFLPALSVSTSGSINISWYDRRKGGADSSLTDYYGERRASPGTNGADFRITTGSTDWTNTSTFVIQPNFGYYTDNATDGSTTYYAWTDGRTKVPQPFVDSR